MQSHQSSRGKIQRESLRVEAPQIADLILAPIPGVLSPFGSSANSKIQFSNEKSNVLRGSSPKRKVAPPALASHTKQNVEMPNQPARKTIRKRRFSSPQPRSKSATSFGNIMESLRILWFLDG